MQTSRRRCAKSSCREAASPPRRGLKGTLFPVPNCAACELEFPLHGVSIAAI